MKFIAPKIELIPARWRLKMAKSTDPPEWNSIPDNGGYTVQPVPAPPSTKLLQASNVNAGGSNQKEMLFSLGNQDFPFHFWIGRTISSSFFAFTSFPVLDQKTNLVYFAVLGFWFLQNLPKGRNNPKEKIYELFFGFSALGQKTGKKKQNKERSNACSLWGSLYFHKFPAYSPLLLFSSLNLLRFCCPQGRQRTK